MRYAIERRHAADQLKRIQAMLVQAEKMAAVGQLASGIAHEVKNPLNIILQCVSYLEPELTARGGEQAEVLQVMREAVTTADDIIKGLLDFSRPSPLQLKPTAMRPVIETALLVVERQIATNKIRLTTDLPATLPAVMADENQMKQVFLNVLMNAIQAMPNGGELRIRASVLKLTEPGQGVGLRQTDVFRPGTTALVCDVQDSGPGIPQELLPKAFIPFFTTKPPGEGVGLGLSICHTILEGHRGLIRLASEEGHGTTVTIMLPVPETNGA